MQKDIVCWKNLHSCKYHFWENINNFTDQKIFPNLSNVLLNSSLITVSKCANSLLKRSPLVVKLGFWFQWVPVKSHHCHFLLRAKSSLKTCILCNFFLTSINWLFTFLFYLSVWLFLSKSAFAVFSLSASSSWTKLQSIFMIIIQTILTILDNDWTIPKTKDLSSAVLLRLFLKQLQSSSSLVQRPLHRPGCSHFHETKHCTETEMLLLPTTNNWTTKLNQCATDPSINR